MNNPVLENISTRRSIRQYTSEPLTKEQLDAILKAAVEAPSARNSQPWHFSVVQNTDILKSISDNANQNLGREGSNIFHGAPMAIFLSCVAEDRWARLDCGIATQTIALAAHSIGLGSVILGLPEAAFTGPKGAEFNTLLKFPDGYSFAVAIAIGTPAGTKEAHPVDPGHIDFIG